MHPTMRIVTDGVSRAWSGPTTSGSAAACTGSRGPPREHGRGGHEGVREAAADRGVGYRATLKGKDVELQVGYSHPVLVPQPDGIEFEVPAPTQVVVRGNDKQQVGEVAATIRKIRKPEPYKGKGIRYENEYVRKKAGKAAKGATA